MYLKKHYLAIITIIMLIITYFIFLVNLSGINISYSTIILFTGFGLLIIATFYFFLFLTDNNTNKVVFQFRMVNENTLMIFLIFLMIITFIIPPITFSEMIIAWEQISLLNYFRGIVFLIGIAFVPGYSVINLMLPNNTISEKFNVEPFLIKIILYPVMSFVLIGTFTLIFDQIGLSRSDFSLILFLSILGLFFLNLVITYHRSKNFPVFKLNSIAISRYTMFILFVSLCVVIIAFSIFTNVLYLAKADGYRAISNANLIASSDDKAIDLSNSYYIYWTYISFGLNSLMGIPAINVNAILFPFLYLFILSIYLLTKAFFGSKKTEHAILSTMFIITFSSLFYIFQNDLPLDRVSYFVYDALFYFRYKSFGLILFVVSLSFVLITVKHTSQGILKIENGKQGIKLLIISSFFLIQSLMVYFLPIIPMIFILFFLILFSYGKLASFKPYTILFFSFISFYIFFDIITHFFFSWIISREVFYFLGDSSLLHSLDINIAPFINALIIYSIFSGLVLLVFIIFKCIKKLRIKELKLGNNLRFNRKIFIFLNYLFLFFLILEIMINLVRSFQGMTYFTLTLHLFFFNVGLIGILAIFSSYSIFKEHKTLFYILSAWIISLFALAFIGLIIDWIKYPNLAPIELPQGDYFRWIHYWFNRIWYYSIIPLSIFASVGVLQFLKKFCLKDFNIRRFNIKSIYLKSILVSILIFFSISNTVIAGMAFSIEKDTSLTSEEAQITGWVTNNIDPGEKIMVDRFHFLKFLDDVALIKVYSVSEEAENATKDDFLNYVTKNIDPNCTIEFYENKYNQDNVLNLLDNTNNGSISIEYYSSNFIYNGSISLLLRTSNTSKGFWINSSLSNLMNGFSLKLDSDTLYASNSTNYEKLVDIENDYWYEIEIDFECTNNNYSGLANDHYKITINGTHYGIFEFEDSLSSINKIFLYTSKSDSNWSISITDFYLKWDVNFKLEHFLFKFTKVIDYLRIKNITYFVFSKDLTPYREKAEEYIDIENELIPYFYNNILYEYENLIIYGSD